MEEEYIKRAAVSPHWLPGGSSFWYRHYLSPGKSEFILVDCVDQTRRLAFNHEGLADALRSQAESAELEQEISPNSLPFTWFEFSPDRSSARFIWNKRKWEYGPDNLLREWDGSFNQARDQLLAKEQPSRSGSQATTVTFANHTDGRLSIYWIDFDSKAKFYNKVSQGQSHEQQTYSDFIVIDESTMAEATSKSSNDDSDCVHVPESESQTRDRKNTQSATNSVSVQDHNVWLTDDKGRETKLSSNGSRETPYDDSKIFLSPDKRFVVVWQYTPEEEHVLHLRESAPADQLEPKVRTVRYLKPGDRVRVDRPRLFDLDSKREVATSDVLFDNPYEIEDIGWSADRSEYRFILNERGHEHLRLIGIKKTGELRNRITRGEWNVYLVTKIDEKNQRIWFQAYGMAVDQDPYYAHLACVDFDGNNLKILTEGDGDHRWTLSPDCRYFIDIWSRILDLEGKADDVDVLLAKGWAAPERFTAPGRDNETAIYGLIIRPSDFDPSKKYPILEDIYAGPYDFHIPKKRSKNFHDVCYKNLKDAGLPDRIAWIKAAAETRPWMDITRVGIMGGSAGGQSAAAALIHHGEFYQAAIADSGCHDNRMDNIWWNEQWMGYPVD
ncbi:hypothetical protein F5883DRAFT_670419 [Diaporthe sp. PMI_573]|nr:hypothetical protein F5883DRAFT_670419 [Diaporthaceae sp. PMI_573]